MLAIYIDAGRDRNGNPKRGWIITNERGEFVDFVDEGFAGSGALRVSPYANVPSTQSIKVEGSVYKDAYTQAYGGVSRAAKRENKLYKKLR